MSEEQQLAECATESRIDFQFKGSGREYFKIWIVNILLSIVTLGIYSAWAKVRRKRYFYGNTVVDGAAFEYLANPKRILIGRIIAVTAYIIFVFVSEVNPFINLILICLYAAVLPIFINKSLKFNAVNTRFRGVRFDFNADYIGTFVIFVLQTVFNVVSLGLYFPYYVYKIKDYVINRSRYGLQHMQFNGKASGFYLIYGLVVVMAGVGLILSFALVRTSTSLAPLLPFLVLVFFYTIYSFTEAKQTNYILNNLRIREISFESRIDTFEYIVIMLTNYALIVLTLGLFLPWANVRAYKYRMERLTLVTSGSLDSFIARETEDVNAVGEEFGDIFDIDVGI